MVVGQRDLTVPAAAPDGAVNGVRLRLLRQHRNGWSWVVLAILLALLILGPLIRLQAKVFEDGLGAIERALRLPRVWTVLGNTLFLACGSVCIAVILGTALAWCTTRVPRRVRGTLSLLPIVPLMVPAVASVTGWIFLLSPRVGLINRYLRDWGGIGSDSTGPVDIYSIYGIVIITGFSLTSFVYLFVYANLRQRGNELEIAAAASGSGPVRTFFTVTLPLLRPAIVYSAGITLLLGIGQFTAPLLLGPPKNIEVVTTVLFRLSQDYPIDYALGAALDLPLIVIGIAVIVMQRRALRNESRFASVAGKSRYVYGRTSWWATVPLVAYIIVSVALPIFALVVTSLSPFWSGKVDPALWTFDAYRGVFEDPTAKQAVLTSIKAAAATLVAVIPLGYVVATALLQRTTVPTVVRVVIDVLSNLALSMPAALFGFALLFTYTGNPFNLYGTTAIIIVAYVTLMLPHAIRPQLASMLSTSGDYVEAAKVSGAGFLRTALTVTLPLVRTGVAVSAALVVVLVFHEFAASVMVRSPTTQIMGTLLYDTYTSGSAPDVAVVALVMVFATAVGVALALAVGGTRALEDV
jgi:iron(III) transport system permease protein